MQNPRGRWLALAVAVVVGIGQGGGLGATPNDEDPFQWLEEIQGEKALAWVKQQNARTLPELEVAARVQDHLRRGRWPSSTPRRRSLRRRAGQTYYNFWQDEETRAACGAAPRWPNTARPGRRGRR